MLILEMLGAPGSGKTTFSNELVSELKGFNIITNSEISEQLRNEKGNKIYRFIREFLAKEAFIFNIRIIKYLLSYRVTFDRVKWAKNFIRFNKILESLKRERRFDLLILDEGILQLVTSIPHDIEIKKNPAFYKLMCSISTLYSDTVFINCELELSEIIKRLRARNNPNHRFDNVPQEKLIELIKIKKTNLNTVLTSLNEANKVISLNLNDINKKEKVNKILFENKKINAKNDQ